MPVAAFAERVVKVVDGDTCVVLDKNKRQIRVRFWGIDAPEKKQAFGEASRRHLAELIAGKDVELISHGFDRYGRLVAEVILNGENENLRQIRDGFAWHYVAYARKAKTFAEAERAARKEHIGLWQDPHPVAPWDFRRRKKR